MNINFMPDLQIMSCVQIVIPILNIPEVQHLIDSYSPGMKLTDYIEAWSTIEKATTEKILVLGVATPSQNMLKNCIRNMLSQILQCKNTYSLVLTECSNHVNKNFTFFWKCDGTIDQKKTVKALIENQDLNMKERFVLASKFCLVDDASCLWRNMMEAGESFTPLQLECQPLVKLWVVMYEEGSECMKINPQLLAKSNAHMLSHVVQMLPYKKQRRLLLRTALETEISTDVMAFCLSKLDKRDQETVLKSSLTNVLECLLTWPHQSLFMNVATFLWTYLTKKGFYDIIWLIFLKILHQEWSDDFKLIEILKEFWFESPVHFKEHVKKQCIFEPLMMVLNCDMHSFPRQKIKETCIQSLEKFLEESVPGYTQMFP